MHTVYKSITQLNNHGNIDRLELGFGRATDHMYIQDKLGTFHLPRSPEPPDKLHHPLLKESEWLFQKLQKTNNTNSLRKVYK